MAHGRQTFQHASLEILTSDTGRYAQVTDLVNTFTIADQEHFFFFLAVMIDLWGLLGSG